MTNGELSGGSGPGNRPPSAEQRRTPRYPVFLDALIAGEGFESRACKIRDFCSNGIFVSFEGEVGAGMVAQRPLVQGERIGIHFTVTVGNRDSAHVLKAQVVRVLTSGVGAELLQPDPLAIAALTQAAQTRPPGGEAALPDLVRAQDKTKVERMAVLRDIRRRLERGFNHWMDQYFSNVEGFLLNVSRDTIDAALQRAIWQFGQVLKQKRSAICDELRAALLEQYDHACTRGVAAASRPGESRQSALGDGLALVETDEFEQFLAVSEAVDRAETALGRALYELNQRLSFLYGARIDKGNNPFGPAYLARQFGDYLRKSHPGAEVLRAALHAYQELAVPEVRRFYEDTNAYLAQSGVPLAGETPRPRVIGSAPRRRPETGAATTMGGPAATGGAGTHAPHPGGTVQSIASQIEQLAASLPAGTPLMVAPVNAFQAAHTLFGLGRDLQRGSMPGRATIDGFGAATAGSMAHYTLGEIGSALRALEMTSGETGGPAATFSRSQLEGALAAQSPAAPAPKAVRDADWDLLELVLELFNAISKDPHVIPEVRPLLRKLRRPVNMVALSDKNFFERTDHPARRVLNNLARVRSASKGGGGESILPELDFIVDKVVGEVAENPAVFDDADERLEVLLAEQEREVQHNLADLARAAEAQAQFMKSRRRETTGGESRMQTSTLGEDWMAWINRVRRLKVGDEMMLGSGPQQRLLRLAWADEDGGSYVFADPGGQKAGSFGLQELAMQLRRGSARLIEDVPLPTVERAMVKSLEALHGRLEQQVHSDVVTHLLNEKAFTEQVDQALTVARQEKESQVVAFLEVHDPAAVQKLPEAEREQRLRERAARVRIDLPPEAQAARLGENRFGVLLRDHSQGRGYTAIEKVLKALEGAEDSVAGGGAKARAGLVPFSTEPANAEQILKSAQAALALAQTPGSTPIRIVHVDEQGDTGTQVTGRLGEHLRVALDNDRLHLALQRIVPQSPGGSSLLPTHMELVPSMQLPGGTRVNARALRAAAEQLQRSADLDRWLVRAAMRWVVDNPDRLPAGGMCIIVLTAESLRDPATAAYIGEEFINTAAPPGRFCFEITEPSGGEANPEITELVNALREYGCRFLYGDFGGEASSFSRVAALKVNLVRIGRMAIRDIANDKGDAALVKSAVEMAHFFGMPAIADCIDSKAALAKAKELAIEYAQGAAVSPLELAV